MLPVSVNAKALEPLALHVDVLLRPFTTQPANLGKRSLAELLGSERFLDHVLDRLAMAVPTGNVRSIKTALRMRFVNKILENLVESMADMNGAVCIRRAVMQDERLSIGVLFENAPVNFFLLPLLKPFRLVFGKVAPHREVGCGQVHRVLVGISHRCLFQVKT